MVTRTDYVLEEHPDLVEMRAGYDRANAKPVAQWLEGLTLLAALFTAVSSWIVGFFGSTEIAASNLISGLAAFAVTLALVAAYGRTHGVAFVLPLIGVWVVISPWIIEGTDVATGTWVSNLVAGAALIVLGLGVMAIGRMRKQKGRSRQEHREREHREPRDHRETRGREGREHRMER